MNSFGSNSENSLQFQANSNSSLAADLEAKQDVLIGLAAKSSAQIEESKDNMYKPNPLLNSTASSINLPLQATQSINQVLIQESKYSENTHNNTAEARNPSHLTHKLSISEPGPSPLLDFSPIPQMFSIENNDNVNQNNKSNKDQSPTRLVSPIGTPSYFGPKLLAALETIKQEESNQQKSVTNIIAQEKKSGAAKAPPTPETPRKPSHASTNNSANHNSNRRYSSRYSRSCLFAAASFSTLIATALLIFGSICAENQISCGGGGTTEVVIILFIGVSVSLCSCIQWKRIFFSPFSKTHHRNRSLYGRRVLQPIKSFHTRSNYIERYHTENNNLKSAQHSIQPDTIDFEPIDSRSSIHTIAVREDSKSISRHDYAEYNNKQMNEEKAAQEGALLMGGNIMENDSKASIPVKKDQIEYQMERLVKAEFKEAARLTGHLLLNANIHSTNPSSIAITNLPTNSLANNNNPLIHLPPLITNANSTPHHRNSITPPNNHHRVAFSRDLDTIIDRPLKFEKTLHTRMPTEVSLLEGTESDRMNNGLDSPNLLLRTHTGTTILIDTSSVMMRNTRAPISPSETSSPTHRMHINNDFLATHYTTNQAANNNNNNNNTSFNLNTAIVSTPNNPPHTNSSMNSIISPSTAGNTHQSSLSSSLSPSNPALNNSNAPPALSLNTNISPQGLIPTNPSPVGASTSSSNSSTNTTPIPTTPSPATLASVPSSTNSVPLIHNSLALQRRPAPLSVLPNLNHRGTISRLQPLTRRGSSPPLIPTNSILNSINTPLNPLNIRASFSANPNAILPPLQPIINN